MRKVLAQNESEIVGRFIFYPNEDALKAIVALTSVVFHLETCGIKS